MAAEGNCRRMSAVGNCRITRHRSEAASNKSDKADFFAELANDLSLAKHKALSAALVAQAKAKEIVDAAALMSVTKRFESDEADANYEAAADAINLAEATCDAARIAWNKSEKEHEESQLEARTARAEAATAAAASGAAQLAYAKAITQEAKHQLGSTLEASSSASPSSSGSSSSNNRQEASTTDNMNDNKEGSSWGP